MKAIVGPMRCKGCGCLVTYGETNGTEWARESRKPPRRAFFDRSRRIHDCQAPRVQVAA